MNPTASDQIETREFHPSKSQPPMMIRWSGYIDDHKFRRVIVVVASRERISAGEGHPHSLEVPGSPGLHAVDGHQC